MLDELAKYDASGLNLGKSIKELKRISKQISYSGLVSGRDYDFVRVKWIRSIIDHIEIPELVGHEEQDDNIEA